MGRSYAGAVILNSGVRRRRGLRHVPAGRPQASEERSDASGGGSPEVQGPRPGGLIGPDAVLLPSLGGSIPMYLFQRGGTPVIGLPIVNHDNNQHAANENPRLQNL
jgi:hypothetical protein